MTNDIKNFDDVSASQIEEARRFIDPSGELSDDQISLFLYVCKERNLDPKLKQIYAVPRKNNKTGRCEMSIQVSIDGFRLIADRTGKYSPGRKSEFEYRNNALFSATAYVKKQTADGTWHEVSATAIYSEYKPAYGNSFWTQKPHIMLEKVAESRALRRAFPSDFSGIYSEDEMDQAKNEKLEDADVEIVEEEKIDKKTVDIMKGFLANHPDIEKKMLKFSECSCIEEIPVSKVEGCSKLAKALIKQKTEKKGEQNES